MRSIWAVAANTIKQALRMKVAVVFIVLLVVLLGALGFSATGDGSLKGRCQSFVSYGLSLTSFLLCILTIVVSVYTLTSDIRDRQIYTVLTKPIRRFEYLLGKFLGVVVLDAGLVILFSAVIYTITILAPRFYDASEDERARVRNEFFTARAGLKPAAVDVSEEVEASYERLKKGGQLEELFKGMSRKEIMARLRKQKELQKRSAAVGRELMWEFEDVKPLDANESLFIRFKYDVSVNPPGYLVYGRWVVGDLRQIRYGTGIETPIYQYDRRDLIRTFYEIEVPAEAVADDGYIGVAFLNFPLNNTTVIFPLDDGLEILYKADTFTLNFIRASLVVFLRLVFLAALGLLSASFLSFPVAILVCLVVFFTASFSGFVLESFDYMSEDLSGVYSYTFRPLIRLLPRFDRFNPSSFLVSARLLSWVLVAKAAAFMVCIKALLLCFLALLIFSYREIAKVTV